MNEAQRAGCWSRKVLWKVLSERIEQNLQRRIKMLVLGENDECDERVDQQQELKLFAQVT